MEEERTPRVAAAQGSCDLLAAIISCIVPVPGVFSHSLLLF